MRTLHVKPSREQSLLRRHPWVFSGALRRDAREGGEPGEIVELVADDGRWLARGALSPASQIRARVWTFDPDETVGPEFFFGRLRRAIERRKRLNLLTPRGACRLVHAENDGLPGLIVDQYADFLVCQFLFVGMERWKTVIVEALRALVPCTGIFERSDGDARVKEGLAFRVGILMGEEPPPLVEVWERDLRLLVDLRGGHKTGLYLDQRENHERILSYCSGATVLNAFSYTGGFGLWALRGGARRVVNVDSSARILSLAQRSIEHNGFSTDAVENIVGDAFQILRRYLDADRRFDVIVLDPPKFAFSVSQVLSASRGYKDINRLAIKLLRPGGILFTFSCSGRVSPPLFQKVVADAALDAGRQVSVIQFLTQAQDHPVSLTFPEGLYLKGLICHVD